MSDVMLTCIDCRQSFEWTYGEQRFYRENKLHQPTHCPSCRELRRHARDAGMQGEIGPLAPFSTDDEQLWDRLVEQAQPSPSQTPERAPAIPPQAPRMPRSAPQPHPVPPAAWQGLDILRIAVFVWLVMMLIVLQLFGWPAAAVVGGVGLAIAIWRFSKR
jgi:hypothetical protein